MTTMTVEDCRKYLPKLNHLSDAEIIKIRDNLIHIVNFGLNRAFEEHRAKIAADKNKKTTKGDVQ